VTAAARKSALRPSPLAVFVARAEARAELWAAGEIDLHDAVDELQHAAVRDGLVAELGQDAVQRLMVEAFAPLRDVLLKFEDNTPEPAPTELTPPAGVPVATIMAAEYLVAQGDPERFRNWLERHSADERAAIRRHLEAKRCH
jgi:hypothetical protein